MAIRTTVAAEHLPQRRQVDGVDYQEPVGLHPYEAFGRGADADALPLGQGQHAAGLIRVDDLRAAVAHLPATLEPLGHDLDAPDIAARIEDLTRVDDRVRHRLQIRHVAALRCGDAQHGQQQPARRVAHVTADRDRVVFRSEVHRRVAAADVAVAQ
jgi:hypothetical protein